MKKVLLFVMIFSSCFLSQAQDAEFTQFYANPIYHNPAFAGTAIGPRFSMNYRNQWSKMPNPFNNFSASFDKHADPLSGGFGFIGYYDKMGESELSTIYGGFVYSYHLNVSQDFVIKIGLQGGLLQKRVDYSLLRFSDQVDMQLGFVLDTKEDLPTEGIFTSDMVPDFSAGFLGFSNKFYFGFAMHHLNEPNLSFYKSSTSVLASRMTFHAGMMINTEEGYTRTPSKFISPNIMFQSQYNVYQINAGLYFIRDKFVSGVWLRQTSANTDAMMMLLGFRQGDFKFAYSYDFIISDARLAARGSHEISMIIEIKSDEKARSDRWKRMIMPDF
jgi:type IX secretion system PorP/SprF family membrane protein